MAREDVRAPTDRYVPALGYAGLTPFYDWVVALTTRERAFKRRLLQQAGVVDGHAVLDLACGTGTLAVRVKQAVPGTDVIGLDGDAQVLALAERKARAAGVDIRFNRGLSSALPYADATFDRVLSTLFLHHLTRTDKERTLREVYRVLRPGGEFHVADWGRPANLLMKLLFVPVRLLDGFPNTADNVRGLLPDLFAAAGFREVAVRGTLNTVFGTLSLYSARK